MRPVAIAGIGMSAVARTLEASVGALTVDACAAALADCGLRAADVDGIATYQAGGDSVPSFYAAQALGLARVNWFADLGGWTPAALAPVIAASDAVASGACDVAIAYRSVKRNRERPPGLGFEDRVGGDMQFRAPFGYPLTAQWLAMWAQRHMHVYGTTEEQLGRLVIAQREHAMRNERAPARDPLTLDDYFASPLVSTPFRVLDCDLPVDGAGAVVITTLDRARDLARPPVRVLGGEIASGPNPDWDQWDDLTHMASRYAAERLWARSGMRATDLDVAQVYDGFSWLALCWLEDLGVCAKGEGGPFIAGGNTAIGGRLPANTHGGSLSGGRLHAISHVVECVEQLRGGSGERQVPNASVGVVTAGGGTMAGALLLASDA